MSVQTLNGVLFDGIVYAEISPREWLTGSNNHRRTLPFGGKPDAEAHERPVRLIITYEADGTTRAYHDGRPYGKPIRKGGLQAFAAGQSQVVFGLRHGTGPGGNRMLTGRIFEARLYDRALTPEEAAAASSGQLLEMVTSDQLLAALKPDVKRQVLALDAKLAAGRSESLKLARQLENERQARGNIPHGLARLAHAILNSKELIYVH